MEDDWLVAVNGYVHTIGRVTCAVCGRGRDDGRSHDTKEMRV